MTDAYFVFINRLRDRMKVLYWENDGFAICWKRLEKESFHLLGIDRAFKIEESFFRVAVQQLRARTQLLSYQNQEFSRFLTYKLARIDNALA